jgi:hypothetical protein
VWNRFNGRSAKTENQDLHKILKHGEIPPAPLYDKRGEGKKVLFSKRG